MAERRENEVLQGIFLGLMGLSLVTGWARGQTDQVVSAMLAGAREGVETAFAAAGGFAFFCGLIEILRQAGAVRGLARRSAPFLQRLMGPSLPQDALEPITVNLTGNLLGLGNAATPAGIEAARRMARGDTATPALCLFLVINSSSVQLLPTTVVALRAAAGSSSPGAVVLPTLLATAVSTAVGILSCKLWEKLS